MPSFDIVSEVDWQEVRNAADQANREIGTRFDFKGSDAKIEQNDPTLTLHGADKFKISQMVEILHLKLVKRGLDLGSLDKGDVRDSGAGKATQVITVRQGIDTESARKIVKIIKNKKMKVQTSIQGEQVRVTGKKRDDLQEVIAMLKEEKLDLPLQFSNFRD